MPGAALSLLRQVFGLETFRGQQATIIEHVVAGGSALVLMPTGGGKSLCYQIPALMRPGLAVVVSPLIALMQDQVGRLQQRGVRAVLINSTLPGEAVRQTIREAFADAFDLLYVTPERLTSDFFLSALDGLADASKLALFAIDEAHCVSRWGHDFRPEYRQLSLLRQRYPQVPCMALTATADPQTRADIRQQLGLHDAPEFLTSLQRPNLIYQVSEKQNARRQLRAFLERHAGESGIIYCATRRKVDLVCSWLQQADYPAFPYHAGLDNDVRENVLRHFLNDRTAIVVATIAFGMGIDRPDVRFVAHLDLPASLEAYYQESGRAGRDGHPAEAWLCYGLHDALLNHMRGRDTSPESSANRERDLHALLAYGESAACRQVTLMAHFGEQIPPCGRCDQCLSPPLLWDATTVAQKALSVIYRTGMQFGAQHLIDVLLGKATGDVVSNQHTSLSTFGIGKELTRTQWRRVLRQLLGLGLIRFADSGHGILVLQEAARPVLAGEQQVILKADLVDVTVNLRDNFQPSPC